MVKDYHKLLVSQIFSDLIRYLLWHYELVQLPSEDIIQHGDCHEYGTATVAVGQYGDGEVPPWSWGWLD